MDRLVERFGMLPKTPAVLTGGGGCQFYFKYPESELRNSAGKLGDGLDIRGDGGYVVAPPSIHPSGKQYQWAKNRSPDDLPLASFPDWALSILASASITYPSHTKNMVLEGKRHTRLVSLGGTLVAAGMSALAVEAALLAENEKRCEPPLPSGEVVELANDITDRYGHSLQIPSSVEAVGGFNFLSPNDWLDQPEETIRWLVQDLLPTGSLTMLSAPPKAGKSTFARAMAMAVANGTPFLGKEVRRGGVLLLAIEEPERNVRMSLRKLGINRDTPLRVHFGRVPPNAAIELSSIVSERRPALVVIDTIGRIRNGTLELNDYISTGGWLEPLLYLAHETDACVCLLYHDNKAGRHAIGYDAIFSVLGSVGIAATIDQLIGLRRKSDDSRTFFTVGRYGDTPETVMGFDLDSESLTALGTAKDIAIRQLKVDITSVLGAGELGRAELRNQVTGKTENIVKALSELVDDGKVEKTGSGRRGDRTIFRLPANVPPGYTSSQEISGSPVPTPAREQGNQKRHLDE
jgi:hypothetical protein